MKVPAAVAILLAAAPSAATAVQSSPDAPLVNRGEQVYERLCSPCHSLGGRGVARASDLTHAERRYRPDDLRRLLEFPPAPHGIPALKKIPREEMDALIQFLLTPK